MFKKIIGILLGTVLLANTALAAGINANIGAQQYMTKAGINIVPILSTYELGSASRRWADLWVVDANISGTLTVAGITMAGNLDLDGYNLILDTDGDTVFLNDRDGGVADDEIDLQIAGAVDFTFSANALNLLSGTNLAIGTASAPASSLYIVHPNTVGGGLRLQDNETDATQKVARIKSGHYTNAEEPVTMFLVNNALSTNVLSIGGGSSVENSMTSISFFTGATSSTLAGTNTFTLNNSATAILGSADAAITARSDGTYRVANVTTGGAGNIAGADLTIAAGLGTGTGDEGTIIFSLPIQAGAGDIIQTTATRLTLDMAASASVLTMSAAQAMTVSAAAGAITLDAPDGIILQDSSVTAFTATSDGTNAGWTAAASDNIIITSTTAGNIEINPSELGNVGILTTAGANSDVRIGGSAPDEANNLLGVGQTSTVTSGTVNTFDLSTIANPAGASSASYRGMVVEATTASGLAQNLTAAGGGLVGMAFTADSQLDAANTLTLGIGLAGGFQNTSGITTEAIAVRGGIAVTAGTVTTGVALRGRAPTSTGTLTNAVGLSIEDQSLAGGTTAYGILIDSQTANATTTRAIELAGTGVNNAIRLGSSANLFSEGAETFVFSDSTNARNITFTMTAGGAQTIDTSAGDLDFLTGSGEFNFTPADNTATSGNASGITLTTTANPGGASSNSLRGFSSTTTTASGLAQNLTAASGLVGVSFLVDSRLNAANTLTRGIGAIGGFLNTSGITTEAIGVRGAIEVTAGTVTTGVALRANTPINTGTLTNAVGLSIQDQSLAGGITAYGIVIDSQTANATDTRAMLVDGVGVNNAIRFGSSVNVYSSGAEAIVFSDTTDARNITFTLTAGGAQTIDTSAGNLDLSPGSGNVTFTNSAVTYNDTNAEGTCVNGAPDAVTIDLSLGNYHTATQEDAACQLTFSGGAAGEIHVLDLTYAGDFGWTIAAGGHLAGDTFDDANCADFQATAASGDRLLLTVIATDGDTVARIGCEYHDQ